MSRILLVLVFLSSPAFAFVKGGTTLVPPPTFKAADGSTINVIYTPNGALNYAWGTDVHGVTHEVEIQTTTQEKDYYIQTPDSPAPVQLTPLEKSICYATSGNVVCPTYTTTIHLNYAENSQLVLLYTIQVDPLNQKIVLAANRTAVKAARISRFGNIAVQLQQLQYTLTYAGDAGVEQINYNTGATTSQSFAVDISGGIGNIRLGIVPKFASVPEINTAEQYFRPAFSYAFAASTLAPGSGIQLYDTYGVPVQWGNGRYFGDAVIALAGIGACAVSGGVGCALAGITGAMGADFWTSNVPNSNDASADHPLNELANAFLNGLCGGWDELWGLVVNTGPPVGCPH